MDLELEKKGFMIIQQAIYHKVKVRRFQPCKEIWDFENKNDFTEENLGSLYEVVKQVNDNQEFQDLLNNQKKSYRAFSIAWHTYKYVERGNDDFFDFILSWFYEDGTGEEAPLCWAVKMKSESEIWIMEVSISKFNINFFMETLKKGLGADLKR